MQPKSYRTVELNQCVVQVVMQSVVTGVKVQWNTGISQACGIRGISWISVGLYRAYLSLCDCTLCTTRRICRPSADILRGRPPKATSAVITQTIDIFELKIGTPDTPAVGKAHTNIRFSTPCFFLFSSWALARDRQTRRTDGQLPRSVTRGLLGRPHNSVY